MSRTEGAERTFSAGPILPTKTEADRSAHVMRQTYSMIALILVVVLAAHFKKATRANEASEAAMVTRLESPPEWFFALKRAEFERDEKHDAEKPVKVADENAPNAIAHAAAD